MPFLLINHDPVTGFLSDTKAKVWVAGHRGLVGSAICRVLKGKGFQEICLKTHQELDLTRQLAVEEFFKKEKPDYVFLAAARVGGIEANRLHQADFLYENLAIATNVLHSASQSGTLKKLLYLGSSCIYPKLAPQPIPESALLTGPLEPTNEGYALAKIAGLKLCEMYRRQYGKNFISVMPTNLYGTNDNFHPEHSHVIPALMRRFHEAAVSKQDKVVVWGTGNARREFLHVDDLAEALMLVMDRYDESTPINVGTGTDCTIRELAELMAEVTGFQGRVEFDALRPDGTPRKVLDVQKISQLGWKPRYQLKEGLRLAYQWAKQNAFIDPVGSVAGAAEKGLHNANSQLV